MAPITMAAIARRANPVSCNSYGAYFDPAADECFYSGWNAFGRWVLLAAIVIGAFLLFLIFSCITARRRRRTGAQPYRFTRWAGGAPPGHGQAMYSGGPQQGNQNYNNNPPTYGQSQGGYQGANQGYYGGQQNGVELQQPVNSYPREGENVYAPPGGPPPVKKENDGIIR